MNFPFYIARRYLLSKKSHNAINVISGISVGGVALATIAMVCVLSVFNGFRDLVASLFTAFDPQIKVVPAMGKTAAADDPALQRIRQWPGVEAASECVEDHALALYADRQIMITLKGVDDTFDRTSDIRHILYGDGEYRLHAANLSYGIPGIQLAPGKRNDGCIIPRFILHRLDRRREFMPVVHQKALQRAGMKPVKQSRLKSMWIFTGSYFHVFSTPVRVSLILTGYFTTFILFLLYNDFHIIHPPFRFLPAY